MKKQYWFPTAFSCWDDEERIIWEEVRSSTHYTMGEQVEAFENEFAAYHNMRHGVMVNSGSSANLVAVSALFNLRDRKPLRPGQRAIVPALAWPTTYAPLVQCGLNLILSDCDETWNACNYEDDWRDARLAIACSILGNPGYLKEWKEFCGINDCYLIEDNCESLGASIDGQLCGTFGLMNTFSFFYSHQISAVEGGMILTNDDECYKICRMLRNHGWSKGVEEPTSFDDEYDFRLFGYNVRPVELHAAVARIQLKKLERFIEERKTNLMSFMKLTEGLPIEQQKLHGFRSPFGLSFAVNSNEIRLRLANALRAKSIDCRLPTGGSFRLHRYGEPWRDQLTPNADDIHRCGMFLGNAPYDISDKIVAAVEVMREVL